MLTQSTTSTTILRVIGDLTKMKNASQIGVDKTDLFDMTVEKMKSQIIADHLSGLIPELPTSFSMLHDFVDANYYGDFIDEHDKFLSLFNDDNDLMIAFMNDCQNAINEWLENGVTICTSCNGSGFDSQDERRPCRDCDGAGFHDGGK